MMNGYFPCLRLLAAAVLLLLAACASTPQASPQRDAEVKEFAIHPRASTLYVYRSPLNRAEDSVLYIDRRLIGATLPGGYFRIDVTPGAHTLHGNGIDLGELTVETRPGQLYFVELGVIAGHSHFRLVPEPLGRSAVTACCALLENWAPGQRPLLR